MAEGNTDCALMRRSSSFVSTEVGSGLDANRVGLSTADKGVLLKENR